RAARGARSAHSAVGGIRAAIGGSTDTDRDGLLPAAALARGPQTCAHARHVLLLMRVAGLQGARALEVRQCLLVPPEVLEAVAEEVLDREAFLRLRGDALEQRQRVGHAP